VQFIIGGINNEPELYELDALGGSLERKKYAVSGSGTELAMTTLDQNYKDEMPEEEAINVAVKAIHAGKKRDIFSGGKSVSVMVIDKKGIRDLDQKTIAKFVKDTKDKDLN
jgi:proteasome beta subunit